MNKFFLVHRKGAAVPFDCSSVKRHESLVMAINEAQRLCEKEKAEFEILEVRVIGYYQPEIFVKAKHIDSLDEIEDNE